MDLRDILNSIENNGNSTNALETLSRQKEEINKKVHFINVYNLANHLEFMISKKIFSKNDVKFFEIQIWKRINKYDVEESYLSHYFYNEKNKEITLSTQRGVDILENLMIELIKGYNEKFISEELKADYYDTIKLRITLKHKCSDEIFNSLLSKEIKVSWDYSKMQNNLNINEDVANKKLKV